MWISPMLINAQLGKIACCRIGHMIMLRTITNTYQKEPETHKNHPSKAENNKQSASKQTHRISKWDYTSALHTLYQRLSIKDTTEWRKFIFAMAAHSVTTYEGTQPSSFKAKNGTFISLTEADQPGKGVVVQCGSKKFILPGISLSELQKQMRESIVEHNDYYSERKSYHRIAIVVALDDLADGLNNKDKVKFFSNVRTELFNRYCANLYRELIPIIKKASTGSTHIALSDYMYATIEEKEQDIVLATERHQVVLNKFTFATLFEKLYQPVYPNSTALLLHHAYGELGWQGLLYNQSHPSLKELQPNYKNQPCRSTKKLSPCNLNFQVPLAMGSETGVIECRHLSTQYLIDIWNDEDETEKFDWNNYSSTEAIAKHVRQDIEESFCTLRENAKRYDLINNVQFGEHLVTHFADMQQPEKNDKLKLLFTESTTHAMAVKLHIKGTPDDPIYVASFYDPNITNGVVRYATRDLSSLKNLTLEHFINGKIINGNANNYQCYYKNTAPISMVLECDLTSLTKLPNSSLRFDKKLTSFACDELTSTHLFFLLSHNLSYDFLLLKDRLQQIGKESPDELFKLLTAKNGNGFPALLFAMHRGHTAFIQAYTELLPLLSNKQQFLLLSEPTIDGKPPLFVAVESGQPEAIIAYGPALPLLSIEQQVELLFAKDAEGSPALCVAMQRGDVKAITALGKLIQSVPIDQQVELLNAKPADGRPPLFLAMQRDKIEAISPFGELLVPLPLNKRLENFIARNAEGIPAIQVAAESEYWDAVSEYVTVLKKLLPLSVEESEILDHYSATKNVNGIIDLLFELEKRFATIA